MKVTHCRKMCCTVKWCPLVTSWATTIHKFQGFEAGMEEGLVSMKMVGVGLCTPVPLFYRDWLVLLWGSWISQCVTLFWPQFIFTNPMNTNLFQSSIIPVWHSNRFTKKKMNDLQIANWLNENAHQTPRGHLLKK